MSCQLRAIRIQPLWLARLDSLINPNVRVAGAWRERQCQTMTRTPLIAVVELQCFVKRLEYRHYVTSVIKSHLAMQTPQTNSMLQWLEFNPRGWFSSYTRKWDQPSYFTSLEKDHRSTLNGSTFNYNRAFSTKCYLQISGMSWSVDMETHL